MIGLLYGNFHRLHTLQCFGTAALSMVTLNMESQNPMGHAYAENRSKTQKLLGVKGLNMLAYKCTTDNVFP